MGQSSNREATIFFLCRVKGGKNLDSKLSWQYRLLTDHHGDIKQSGTFFFTQSVITKVEIIPFFMGILFIV